MGLASGPALGLRTGPPASGPTPLSDCGPVRPRCAAMGLASGPSAVSARITAQMPTKLRCRFADNSETCKPAERAGSGRRR